MSRWLLDELPVVAERLAAALHCLLGADYDGVLAPVAAHPDEADLPSGTRRALRDLGHSRDVTVAVVSGRGRNDLLDRVSFPGFYYVGNHGLEISGPGLCFVESSALARSEQMQTLAEELATRLQSVAGATIEDKGMSITIHHRDVAPSELERMRSLVHGLLARTDYPFVLSTVERALEVRPRVDWNYASALDLIRQHQGRPDALIIYLGSATADEAAFESLVDEVTVRVGPPSETAAQYYLADPQEVEDFLFWLAEQAGGGLGRAEPSASGFEKGRAGL